MTGSEIAQIRLQIEQTCQAMNMALTGYAITARHDIIAHKYQLLGQYEEQLAAYIGEERARDMVVEIYDQEVKGVQDDECMLLPMHLPAFIDGYRCGRRGYFEGEGELSDEDLVMLLRGLVADGAFSCGDETLLQWHIGRLLGQISGAILPGEGSGINRGQGAGA